MHMQLIGLKTLNMKTVAFAFLVFLFVCCLFFFFFTNYMPTVLKHDFKSTFSAVPLYLILVFPCITVIIQP